MTSSQHRNVFQYDLVDLLNESNDDTSEAVLNDNILTITNASSSYYDIDSMKELLNQHKAYNKLSAMHLNIQSLPSKFQNLKIMLATLNEENIQFDLILVCETFLNCSNHTLYNLEGYTFINNFRKTAKGGGVGIYISNTLNYKQREDMSIFEEKSFESIFIEVVFPEKNIVIGEIYRNPASNKRLSINKYEAIFEKLSKENKDIIIGTDQNINLLDPDNIYAKNLLNIAFASGMIPTISKPTRITESTASLIDNVYLNESSARSFISGILSYDISDHLPIFTVLKQKITKITKNTEFEYRNMNEKAIYNIKTMLSMVDWSNMESKNVNSQYDILINKINECINICAPMIKIKVNPHFIKREKWITKGLIKSSVSLTKLYKKTKLLSRNNNYIAEYRQKRNLFNKLIRRVKKEYHESLFETYKGDLAKTWRVYSSLMNKSKTEIPCSEFNVNGKKLTDPQLITNEFCKYFTEIGKSYADNIPQSTKHFSEYLRNKQENSFYFIPTNPVEISQMIDKLKPKRCSGIDRIPCKLIKELKHELLIPLTIIVNNSLESGTVPEGMKIAKIIPLFKAKNKSELSNYRPISILPSLSKVLEKIVHKRLYNYAQSHNILFESQYGFRNKRSTINAVTEFVLKTLSNIDEGKLTVSLFLDLSKAFDTINHDILLYKLHHYGIRGTALAWFDSYLKNRTHYVSYNKCDSNIRNMTCGVPQGSILGPLLFILYINDLSHSLQFSSSILFADDSTIYASSTDTAVLEQQINSDLCNLQNWFRANKLSLNTAKSNYMLFPREKFDRLMNIKIENDNISYVRSVKFLGLNIDDQFKWTTHIEHVKSKLSKSIYVLRSLKHMIGQKHLLTLYNTIAYPYISYGNLLWGGTYKTLLKRIDVLQKKHIRVVNNLEYNAHTMSSFYKCKTLKLSDMHCIELNVFMFSLIGGFLPKSITNMFKLNNNIHLHNTRQRHLPHVVFHNTQRVNKSIFHTATQEYSNIPLQLKTIESVKTFKRHLKDLLLKKYKETD